MTIISWNVEGTGEQGFYSTGKDLFFKHNPNIFFLMETRVNPIRASKVMRIINLRNVIEIPPEGSFDRIWLL